MKGGLLLALVAAGGSASFAQCTLFAAQAADEDETDLLILDPATGTGTPVGDIGGETTGLAFHPSTRVLYGSTAEIQSGSFTARMLLIVDPTTGAGTEVGSFGTTSTLADLAFDPLTGVLYGWRAKGDGDLYTVNLQTGTATLVGESGLALTGGQGLTFGPGNQLFLAGEGTTGLLRTIDKATGLSIGSVQLSNYAFDDNINSLAYDGKRIFGITNDHSDLITIDPVTGIITTIGHAGLPDEDSVDAVAFLCTQSAPAVHDFTLLAIAIGLLAIGVAARRRFATRLS